MRPQIWFLETLWPHVIAMVRIRQLPMSPDVKAGRSTRTSPCVAIIPVARRQTESATHAIAAANELEQPFSK
jgi:hypothetical protein